MIIWAQKSQGIYKKLLKLVSSARYKINIQESIVLLYTSNEYMTRKFSKKYNTINNPLKSEYLGVNLRKHIQDLYFESYPTLIKEAKEDTIHRKTCCVHGLDVNIKMSILN